MAGVRHDRAEVLCGGGPAVRLEAITPWSSKNEVQPTLPGLGTGGFRLSKTVVRLIFVPNVPKMPVVADVNRKLNGSHGNSSVFAGTPSAF